jgi:leader peptidase (prepilin peptidase)/N-methyltransferase
MTGGLVAIAGIDLNSVFPLVAVFVLGTIVGSFLNVCIYRLPLEKSILWPGSHCGHCFQPIRAIDNIPLVSYWLLGGRCRSCGLKFSMRYFFVELLTGLLLVVLYELEVVRNVHQLDARVLGAERYDLGRLAIFGYHAVLMCFLLVASFADFDLQIIPLSLTATGTIVGLVGAVLFPWPWPYTPQQAAINLPGQAGPFFGAGWRFFGLKLRQGLYPWPAWVPLPAFLAPGGNWQTGLATGLAGIVVGTMMMRAIRFFFGLGMGAEYMEAAEPAQSENQAWLGVRILSWVQRVGGKALGLGDADIMMMAGAFLGWQLTIVSFIAGIFPALAVGVGQVIFRGNKPMPFVPALALGTMVTCVFWHSIGPNFQPLFFDQMLMTFLAIISCTLMIAGGFGIRMFRRLRGQEPG